MRMQLRTRWILHRAAPMRIFFYFLVRSGRFASTWKCKKCTRIALRRKARAWSRTTPCWCRYYSSGHRLTARPLSPGSRCTGRRRWRWKIGVIFCLCLAECWSFPARGRRTSFHRIRGITPAFLSRWVLSCAYRNSPHARSPHAGS